MAEWKDPEIAALRVQLASVAVGEGAPEQTWDEQRQMIDGIGAMTPPPEGVAVNAMRLGGVAAERITPTAAAPVGAMLYLHGGGYCIGGPASHRAMVGRIALAAGVEAWALDYRLAPEAPFPAAVDDALAAYRALLEAGQDPGRLVVAGDSAGGGLTLATFLAAKAAGLPAPGVLYVLSPWANLAQTGAAYEAKAASDPLLTRASLDRFAGAYLPAGVDPAHPHASPLAGDFTGLPPILIQVGSEEILLSDALGVAEKASFAGADVTLRVWPEMIHIWPFFPLSAGGRAIAEAAAWIRASLDG